MGMKRKVLPVNGKFLKIYRELARDFLGRPLSTGEIGDEAALGRAERRLGVVIPQALQIWHRVAGKADGLNKFHNQILAPEEMYVEEGHLFIMEENQGVVSWGIPLEKLSKPDPVVWQRVNNTPPEWYSEEKTFSELILDMFRWYKSWKDDGE